MIDPEPFEVSKARIKFGDSSWKGFSVMPKYENGQNAERINNNFVYHKPKDDQPERYEIIRETARHLAVVINMNTPTSREQSLAFTAVEEAVMWANAAIARNE